MKGSRKKDQGQFFKEKAICKKPECPCEAYLTIDEEFSNRLKVTFKGNVRHDVTKPVSLKDNTGDLKKSMQSVFRQNWMTPPSKLYRQKFQSIPSDIYASGNRSQAGTLKKAQHAKSKMRLQSSRLGELHKALLEIDRKQKDEDERIAVALKHEHRINGIRGYMQGITIDNTLIRLVLFDDPMVRLFHVLSSRDILYLDATGNIVENCLTIRHPFGLAPPFPVGEYITSSHTIESLRFFFMSLREKENIMYPNSHVEPKLLVSDLSIPLYSSALLEFTRETVDDYLNRTFRIVQGKASAKDLDLMLVHLCNVHSMNLVKRRLIKLHNNNHSKVNFGMRMYGRLICCTKLDECTEYVKHVYNVMMSPDSNQSVEESCQFIQDSINTFSHNEENSTKDDEPQIDDVSLSSENDEEEKEMDDITTANADGSSQWQGYWDEILRECENNLLVSKQGGPNKYHMPEFFHYLRKSMLAIIAMLSRMCLGDLSHIDEKYEELLNVPETSGAKNYLINNTTNALVEKFFAVQKSDKSELKFPLEMFIHKHWSELQGLQRQFWDGIMRGINESRSGSIGKREEKKLKKSFNHGKNPSADMNSEEEKIDKVKVPEE